MTPHFAFTLLIFLLLHCIPRFSFAVDQHFLLPEGYVDMDSVISSLEKSEKVRIFYKKDWLSENKIPDSIADFSLEEVLEYIAAENQLAYQRKYDAIIFYPELKEERISVAYEDQSIVVGSIENSGRYTEAQLKGIVFDGKTNNPLPGATVHITDSPYSAVTNVQGEFSMELPVGDHEMRVSFVGYHELKSALTIYNSGEITLNLFEDMVLLEGITVSARKEGDRLKDTRMSIITMDALSLKGLPLSFGETDIIRSFTLMPGVQSVGEFGSGFAVRGGSTDQNLILLQGMPLFNASHLFGLVSVINADVVGDVTLLKGGIPSKYGERVSSVMDINLQDPHEKDLRISGGLGILNSRLSIQSPLFKDKVSVSLSGRSSYSNWFLENLPDNDLMNSNADFYDFTSMVSFRPNNQTSLSFFFYQSEDTFDYASQSLFHYKNQLASVHWNFWTGEKVKSEFIAGFSRYDYRVKDNLQNNPANSYLLENNISYNTLKYNINYDPNDTHLFEMGFHVVSYDVNPGEISPLGDDSFVEGNAIEDENAVELAVYISDQISLHPRLDVELGLRYSNFIHLGPQEVFLYEEGIPGDLSKITDTIYFAKNQKVRSFDGWEPRVSIRYGLTEKSSLKMSYNRIHQYINLLSNTSVVNPSDVWKLSDYYLDPLRGDQITLGYFLHFREPLIETSAEVYYKSLQGVVEYKNGATLMMNEFIEKDLINAVGYSYGAEIAAEKKSGHWQGFLSYTYSISRIRSDEHIAENQINKNNYFPSNHEQPHSFVFNNTWELTRRWKLTSTFVYRTGRPVTLPELVYDYNGNQIVFFSDRNKYRMPDYHRLDIGITWDQNLKVKRSWKGSWTLSVVNVYSRKNAYSIFYQKEKPSIDNDYRQFSLNKMYIIGKPFPTLTYNFVF